MSGRIKRMWGVRWALPVIITIAALSYLAPKQVAGQDLAEPIRQKQEAFLAEHGNRVIDSIYISGNDRTRRRVIMKWINVRPGDSLASFKAVKSLENLLFLRKFTDISFDYRLTPTGGVSIGINLKERWTFFPVPIFWAFNDTRLGGLFLAEQNFLGYNKQMVAGGLISNRGWQYLMVYDDPHIFQQNYFGRIRSTGGSIFVENALDDGTVVQSFQQERFDVLYNVGRTFGTVFSPTITGGVFRVRMPEDENDDKINPPDGGDTYYQGLKLVFNNTKNRWYFDKGLRMSVEYQKGWAFGSQGVDFYNWFGTNKYTREAFLDHTISAEVNWGWSDFPTFLEHRLGGLDATKTLPAFLISADRFVASSLTYQIPAWKPKWGVITTVWFYELGSFKRDDEQPTAFYGPGAGFRLFLRNIAIPALGFDMGYNQNSQTVQYSIVVGFRPQN